MRFQAYGVGLPKTGSTTLAAAFALSRSAHEWSHFRLQPLGEARLDGRVDDAMFWRLAGGRLTKPILAMDVCTSHHLYADALVERFPDAHFVWTTRGVRDWANSLLDMYIREGYRAELCGLEALTWVMRFPGRPFDGTESIADQSDAVLLTTLIRTWSRHMRRMREVLPERRTIMVPVKDLSSRLRDISDFVGADPDRLCEVTRPANARPPGLTFDRWAHSSDWRVAYDVYAADLMCEMFPDEHEEITAIPRGRVAPEAADVAWAEYVQRTRHAMAFASPEDLLKHRCKLQRLTTTARGAVAAVSANQRARLAAV